MEILKYLEGSADVKKQLKFSNGIGLFLALTGIVMIILKFIDIEYLSGLTPKAEILYNNFTAILIAVGIVRIIKNTRLLKNEEAVKNYGIKLRDERYIFLHRRASSLCVSICIWLGYILSIIFLPIDSTVSYTLIYSMCGVVFVYLIIVFILNRIM